MEQNQNQSNDRFTTLDFKDFAGNVRCPCNNEFRFDVDTGINTRDDMDSIVAVCPYCQQDFKIEISLDEQEK